MSPIPARIALSLALALAGAASALSQTPSADDLLAASIAYHDPEGAWATGSFRLSLEESRPDGTVSETSVLIDNRRGRFEIDFDRDDRQFHGVSSPAGCAWRLDGSTEFTDEERDELGLTCERLQRLRNYYTYLWGLPMKLRDPGTVVDGEVKERTFAGHSAWEMRVTYEAEVGSDVWYFYFDPGTRELVGYRFYHDETANDGEWITLEGIEEGAGLRLPKTRTWYTHADDRHLGTDTLVAIDGLP